MSVLIELDADFADQVVAQVLKEAIDSLEEDLDQMTDGVPVAIFSMDREEDMKQTSEMLKAMKLTLSWFSVEGE